MSTRKADGTEIFSINEQQWVDYWLKQPCPVILVIGTFIREEERVANTEKLGFADVRWMEISTVLRRETENGKKPARQIEFKGERLDLTSIRQWRDRVLNA